jgi:hypothetical protein
LNLSNKVELAKIPPPSNKNGPSSKPTERPWSSLIDKKDRDDAWQGGQSLDSKKMTEALGFLDMKQICYCLAHAIMKHIEFG